MTLYDYHDATGKPVRTALRYEALTRFEFPKAKPVVTPADGPKKHCSRCKVEKLLTDFHRCYAQKDGRQRKCRTCQSELLAMYRERERNARPPKPVRMKACDRCGAMLPTKAFVYPGLKGRVRRYAHCQACHQPRSGPPPKTLAARREAA